MTKKTILITGSTDGIGRGAALVLRKHGHNVIIHGRSQNKINDTLAALERIDAKGSIGAYSADLSTIAESSKLADEISNGNVEIDVLINNAGVLRVSNAVTADELDVRFAVNTIAPYILARALLPHLPSDGRIINISSAAQRPITPGALAGKVRLSEMESYSESKLALIMWSNAMAANDTRDQQVIVSVNPASLIDTNMARDAFGIVRNGEEVGVDILVRAALSEEFAGANGRYYDNDTKRFTDPNPEALDAGKNAELVASLDTLIANHSKN